MRFSKWKFSSVVGVVALAWIAAAAAQTPAPATAPSQGSPAALAQAAPADAPASAAAAGAPGAVCLKCHDDEIGSMLGTRHAVKADARTPWGTGKAFARRL